MVDSYDKIMQERFRREQEQRDRVMSLEKQLKMWKARQTELRQVSVTGLDQKFIRRNLDKCSEEIKRITDALARV